MLKNELSNINRLNPFISKNDQKLSLTISLEKFDELAKEIQSIEIEWDKFSKSLKEISGIGRVMNRFALANPYSAMIEVNLSNSPESILVLLSTLGGFYGFYFCSQSKKAVQPENLFDHNLNRQVENIEWENPHISFFPFSEEQNNVKDQIEILLLKSFPRYVRFDYNLVGIPVFDSWVGEEFYPKLDLFQVVFIYEPVCF
ncbi:hypothetical protein [Algoriphagus mannitolivorans]|uniref:hypothetical protein n=1 Tax=Algoriphagus mannitolivorans TaxID=226504 RepID=UPI0003FBE15F|nr:hypothetical protein [Algoriphagus mannitolivorans]